MGKGDRKSRKGKIFMGSYGITRKRKTKNRKFVVQKAVAKPLIETAQAVSPDAGAEAAKKIKRAAPKKKTAEKKESKPSGKKVTKKEEGEANQPSA